MKHHNNAQKNAWVQGVTGQTHKVEDTHPAIYTVAQNLGLDMHDKASWLKSPSMVKWITQHKDTKFCWEWMLRRLGLTTIWDVSEKKLSTLVPLDTEFTDMSEVEVA
jgi:hypothetical protein